MTNPKRYQSVDSWACMIVTHVLNDIAEHHPGTSDDVMTAISDSIMKTVEHLWPKRPADEPEQQK